MPIETQKYVAMSKDVESILKFKEDNENAEREHDRNLIANYGVEIHSLTANFATHDRKLSYIEPAFNININFYAYEIFRGYVTRYKPLLEIMDKECIQEAFAEYCNNNINEILVGIAEMLNKKIDKHKEIYAQEVEMLIEEEKNNIARANKNIRNLKNKLEEVNNVGSSEQRNNDESNS